MSRARFNIPDLDLLDSPLVSPTPISLSGIPGSALAERIFNDPESWEDNDDDVSDIPEDITAEDEFEWLAEEIEKVVGAFHSPSTPIDTKALDLIPPPSASPHRSRLSVRGAAGLRGMGKRASVRPISLAALFEHSRDDFSGDMQQQLSKILESGRIPYHLGPPHSSALSPPSTSGTSSTLDSPMPSTSTTSTSSEGASPVVVNSASATLSFLGWYGIYPDSPLRPPKSARFKAPLLKLQVPSPKPGMKPSPLLTPASATSDTTIVPPLEREREKEKTKRASPAPPPGLDPPANSAALAPRRTPSPPGLSRSPSPLRAAERRGENEQKRSESPARLNVTTERGRALHMTAPPSYSREPSPAPAVSRSKSTTGGRPSRDPTPVRGMSQDMPIRRLPLIPGEATPNSNSNSRPSTPPQPLPQPPVHAQAQAELHSHLQSQSQSQAPQPPPRPSRTASPAPAMITSTTRTSSPAPSLSHPASSLSASTTASTSATATASPAAAIPFTRHTSSSSISSSLPRQSSADSRDSRPASVRSPPMGPRTRSRASQDAMGRPVGPMGHRPPVLRL